jgi:hypothetical protein
MRFSKPEFPSVRPPARRLPRGVSACSIAGLLGCCGSDGVGAAEPADRYSFRIRRAVPDVEVVFARGTFEPACIGATGIRTADTAHRAAASEAVDDAALGPARLGGLVGSGWWSADG